MQKGALVQGSGACYCRYYEKHGEHVIRRTKHLGYVRDYATKTSILPETE